MAVGSEEESLASGLLLVQLGTPDAPTPRAVRRYLERPGRTMLLAETEGEAIGFACVDFRPGTDDPLGFWGKLGEFFTRKRRALQMFYAAHGYIAYLYVAQEFRRRGIGGELVLAAGEWAKARGAKALDLSVLAANDAARKLYEKIGMTELVVTYRMEI